MMQHLKQILKTYWPLILIIVLYTGYFSVLSLLKYKYFYMGIFDVGNMKQTLWNTLHGHFFMETDPAGTGRLVSRISDHADFLLLFFTPIFAIFSSAAILLVSQAFIVALGTIPIYLLTKEKTNSAFYPIFFSCIYLLLPSVENPNVFEFHAVTLSMTLLLFLFYYLYKKRYTFAIAFTILSLFAKEEIGFTITLMAIYFLLTLIIPKKGKEKLLEYAKGFFTNSKKQLLQYKKQCIFLVMLALMTSVYSVTMIAVIIPHFRGGQSLYLANYDGSMSGVGGVLTSLVKHPGDALHDQVGYAAKYSGDLLFPLGGISLFSPGLLFISFPEWAIDTLSHNHSMQSIFYQYPSAINPFIILSAISGFFTLQGFLKKRISWYKEYMLILFVSFAIGISSYLLNPLPFMRNYATASDLSMNINASDRQEINLLAKKLPKTASISADNNLGSHLADRLYIYIYPTDSTTADYIFLKQPAAISQPHYHVFYEGMSIIIYQKDGLTLKI